MKTRAAADCPAAARSDLHARRDRSRAARHGVRVELHLRDDEPVAGGLQLADVDAAARARVRIRPAADRGCRIRDSARRATIVASDDADANRATRVGVADLVVRIGRSLDLAAVVAARVAAQPDVRVGDGLVARPLTAVRLQSATDRRRSRRCSARACWSAAPRSRCPSGSTSPARTRRRSSPRPASGCGSPHRPRAGRTCCPRRWRYADSPKHRAHPARCTGTSGTAYVIGGGARPRSARGAQHLTNPRRTGYGRLADVLRRNRRRRRRRPRPGGEDASGYRDCRRDSDDCQIRALHSRPAHGQLPSGRFAWQIPVLSPCNRGVSRLLTECLRRVHARFSDRIRNGNRNAADNDGGDDSWRCGNGSSSPWRSSPCSPLALALIRIRQRRTHLKERFGPEYQRAVADHGVGGSRVAAQ